MTDIEQLAETCTALSAQRLSAQHATRLLYSQRLIARAKKEREKGAENRQAAQLSYRLVEKAHNTLHGLEGSLTEQYNARHKCSTADQSVRLSTHFSALINDINQHQLRSASTQAGIAPDSCNKNSAKSSVTPSSTSISIPGVNSDDAITRDELQSFKQYQSLFEKMSLERLLTRVMQEIPENAGPLNPERLVIRSFKTLQDLSPEYLSYLISYYESLLSLQLLNGIEK